jgi:hypothetical protein
MGHLRLNQAALQERADRAYYQDTLFDGIAYTLAGDAVTRIESYQAGRASGAYQEPAFKVSADSLRLRYESLSPWHEDYDEPLAYQGKPFNGLAYRFDGDHCVGQSLIEAGEAIQTIGWLKDGTLSDYSQTREAFQEYAVCYASGQLQHLKLDMKDHFSLELKWTEDQALSTLILTGDYFEQAPQVASQFFFFPLSSKDALSSWPAAPRLFLSGDAIEDTVFQHLQAQGTFKSLQKLCLYQTQITGAEIEKLIQYRQLQKLEIVEKGSALKDSAAQVKASRPDLLVDYEGAA